MGKKTSKKETKQKIDPDMRARGESNMALVESIAAMGYNPYTGMDTAGFTPGQKAGFESADAASSAFGMPAGAMAGILEGPQATTGPAGISGYSSFDTMMAENPQAGELMQKIAAFFEQASKSSKVSGTDGGRSSKPVQSRYSGDAGNYGNDGRVAGDGNFGNLSGSFADPGGFDLFGGNSWGGI